MSWNAWTLQSLRIGLSPDPSSRPMTSVCKNGGRKRSGYARLQSDGLATDPLVPFSKGCTEAANMTFCCLGWNLKAGLLFSKSNPSHVNLQLATWVCCSFFGNFVISCLMLCIDFIPNCKVCQRQNHKLLCIWL